MRTCVSGAKEDREERQSRRTPRWNSSAGRADHVHSLWNSPRIYNCMDIDMRRSSEGKAIVFERPNRVGLRCEPYPLTGSGVKNVLDVRKPAPKSAAMTPKIRSRTYNHLCDRHQNSSLATNFFVADIANAEKGKSSLVVRRATMCPPICATTSGDALLIKSEIWCPIFQTTLKTSEMVFAQLKTNVNPMALK